MGRQRKKNEPPVRERLERLFRDIEERIDAARAALAVTNADNDNLARYVGYCDGLQSALRDLSRLIRGSWMPAGSTASDLCLPEACAMRPPDERLTQEHLDSHAVPELCLAFHGLPAVGSPAFRALRDSGSFDAEIERCAGMRAAHARQLDEARSLAAEIETNLDAEVGITRFGELVIPEGVQPFEEVPEVGSMHGRDRVTRVAVCGHDARCGLPPWVEELFDEHERWFDFVSGRGDRDVRIEERYGLLLVVESEYVPPTAGEQVAIEDVPEGHAYYRISKNGISRRALFRGEHSEKHGTLVVYAGEREDDECATAVPARRTREKAPRQDQRHGPKTVIHDGLPQLVLL